MQPAIAARHRDGMVFGLNIEKPVRTKLMVVVYFEPYLLEPSKDTDFGLICQNVAVGILQNTLIPNSSARKTCLRAVLQPGAHVPD